MGTVQCGVTRLLVAFSAVAVAASAQTIVPLSELDRLFPPPRGELKCQVQPTEPILDFSLRLHARYRVRVPLDQYQGRGHRWTVGIQVKPEHAAQPVLLVDTYTLPDAPPADMDAEASGGYLLGLGSYRAQFLLRDDLGRECRAEWTIAAQLAPYNYGAKLTIAPGTVDEVFTRQAHSAAIPGARPLNRLMVLLDAAPVNPQFVHPDVALELDVLSALLLETPARSVGLVAFNLDQQKEIYRRDNFTPDHIDELQQAMFDLQMGTVDVRTLQNSLGHVDLLEKLAREELHAANRADAVVFLGPHTRFRDKPPANIEQMGQGGPRFFYIEYQSGMLRPLHKNFIDASGSLPKGEMEGRRGPPASPAPERSPSARSVLLPRDTIDYLVAGLNGKTLIVQTPGEFGRAVNEVVATSRRAALVR